MKQFIADHIKNIGGWTTSRKILCFAVDDYGNVRVKSKSALSKLEESGLKLKTHFDQNDALDTTEDFEQLYEVLSSVKDIHNNCAIFTPYALSANINFDKMLSGAEEYKYELLPQTYEKLASEDKAYKGAYKMLKEGIEKKLIKPQCHGREHLNVDLFNIFLKEKNPILWDNLRNHSYTGLPRHASKPNVFYTEAYGFWDIDEIEQHKQIIKDGVNCFKSVYGYPSKTFTAPGQKIHPSLFKYLEELGIQSIDKPRKTKRHLGEDNYKVETNKLGFQEDENHVTVVRNAAFEPASGRKEDWVNFTFSQIKAAFRLNKPAIVSTHRVNFCGHTNPENRTTGLKQLKQLLHKVKQECPEVEFMAIDELSDEIIKTSRNK
jgi:hypothetical protein